VPDMDKWIDLVKAKMSELNITQEILADRLGMSQGGVGHWLNKRRQPGVEDMNRVLEALGLDFLEVAMVLREVRACEDDIPPLAQRHNPSFRYPVSDWRDAPLLRDGELPVYGATQFELSDYHAHGSAFWLKVEGDAMTAPSGLSIAHDMLILVDPEAEVLPGKLVIAQWPGSAAATFRKLIEEGGQRYLIPLNPTYPKALYTADCRIIGVVVQATAKF
jgi:SOS-response transcriptional repressor LexA